MTRAEVAELLEELREEINAEIDELIRQIEEGDNGE